MSNNFVKKSLALLPILLSAAVFSLQVYAAPPQAALDACKGKNINDQCSFTGPMGKTHEGSCHEGPLTNNALACRPLPPQASFDACNGKTEGSSCSFAVDANTTKTGYCHTGPMGKTRCFPGERFAPGKTGTTANPSSTTQQPTTNQ
ncbi:MAG: hypothetical protein ACHQJ6_00135 [Candidatus Berkiellales bacterium]